jgi:hypothetical protein
VQAAPVIRGQVLKVIANVLNMYRLNIQHLVECIRVGLDHENGHACPFCVTP